ncbi:MAG: hypothetical protein D6725_02620 [Planctomycetota bacterium]|nr:MAG: hypothetical protein D6725_02620 [Planctomycetota bacterium]
MSPAGRRRRQSIRFFRARPDGIRLRRVSPCAPHGRGGVIVGALDARTSLRPTGTLKPRAVQSTAPHHDRPAGGDLSIVHALGEWSAMGDVKLICFLSSYAVAAACEFVRLRLTARVVRWVGVGFLTAGLVAHTWYLWDRGTRLNLPPLLSSTQDWMLVLAWIAAVFTLFLTLIDRRVAVGLFLLPFIVALVAVASLAPSEPNELVRQAARGTALRNWGMLHATLLVFGIAGVLIAVVLSAMYLYQHHRLRAKHGSGRGPVLPSLVRLARLNWWAIVISVPLITLGMATGVGLALVAPPAREGRPVTLRDPVVIGNAIAWLVMMVLFVWLLRADHPPAKRVARLTVWVFGFLLVMLTGLQILSGGPLPSWHR